MTDSQKVIKQIYWDKDVTEEKFRKMLKDPISKLPAMARLISYAPFEAIWNFITLKELKENFDNLKLRFQIKKNWETALSYWN